MQAEAPTGSPRERLRALGVSAVFGERLDGLRVIEVPRGLAPVLALAHQKLFGGTTAIHRGGHLVIGARAALAGDGGPGGDGAKHGHGAAQSPKTGDRPQLPRAELERLRDSRGPLVLAGPGVIEAGAVPGLHALAIAARLGVLNTWTAKGLFDWRSPHHLGTVGLQERDLELAGLARAGLVVTVGLDPMELPVDPGEYGDVVELEPGALGLVAEQWSAACPTVSKGRGPISHAAQEHEIKTPPLRELLAQVTQGGWRASSLPMAPSRVTLAYSTLVGAPGGMVAADPGLTGYWLARTYPTSRLGEALVPAEAGARGFALACTLLARRRDPELPVVAVAGAPLGPVHEALLELADGWRLPVPIEVWDREGPPLSPEDHAARLVKAMDADHSQALPLATDESQLAAMIEAAGDIVAWDGSIGRSR